MITKEQADNILSLAKKYADAVADAQQEWDADADVSGDTREMLDKAFDALVGALEGVTQQA